MKSNTYYLIRQATKPSPLATIRTAKPFKIISIPEVTFQIL